MTKYSIHACSGTVEACLCVCLLPTGAQSAGPDGLKFGMGAMKRGTVYGWV